MTANTTSQGSRLQNDPPRMPLRGTDTNQCLSETRMVSSKIARSSATSRAQEALVTTAEYPNKHLWTPESLRKAVQAWDWSVSPEEQTSQTLRIVECLVPGRTHSACLCAEKYKHVTLYEAIVSGLLFEFERHGYGPFSLPHKSRKITCYYMPDAQIHPLPEWLNGDFFELVGPTNPLAYVSDMGIGPWKPPFERG